MAHQTKHDKVILHSIHVESLLLEVILDLSIFETFDDKVSISRKRLGIMRRKLERALKRVKAL